MSQLERALFTKTQRNVLGLMYSRPDKSFYTKEILRLTGMGVATISRELTRMVSAGILTMTKIGNQHHYQANPVCPIYSELLGIVKKTVGVAGVISDELLPVADQLVWVFVFGSVASGKESSTSDIDLMVIGDIEYGDLLVRLYPAQEALGREINPKLYRPEEWRENVNLNKAFVKGVLSKSRIDVIGDGNEFGKLAGKEPGKN